MARLAGDNLRERTINLENEFKFGSVPLKEIESKINNEKRELLDKKKRMRFPYVIVQECLEKFEILSKNIRIKERQKAR